MKAPSLWLGLAFALRAAHADNPATRVVGLLQDLQARIEKDGEAEQETYDKYACWCEKTSGKTAASITAVKELLKTTGTTILKLKGSVATLSSEIKGLAEDIKKNQDQQGEQTSIREKENTAFMAEKVELESALGALEKAIVVLKAATGDSASFVQTSKWASTMSDVVSKMSQASVSVRLSDRQLALLSELSGKKYAPQSATIQGILSDMYATFGKNLQTSTSDEAKAHRNYEDLMATYLEQLNTLQETVVKKEQKKSEDAIQLADATQLYADSEDKLKAEITLFEATKKSCTEKTADWSKRSTLRTAELDGIKKALEILTSDEAKELFAKSIKPGFSKGAASLLQVSSQSAGANKAFQVLEAHARQSHSFRLASLAATVRLESTGHFDAVIKSIDKLLAQVKAEEQTDIKKVDECKETYQGITLKKNDLDWKIENNEAKVQQHDKAVTHKTDAKKVTIADIATADKTLDDMAKKRKEENDAYLQAKSDDEKAIVLLEKAKAALAEYGMKFLQQDPEPEMKLSGKDSAGTQTKGVVSLLDMIIEDLDNELAEGKSAEAAAQLDYEAMKKAVEDQKAKLTKAKINLDGQIAEEGTAKTAEEDLQKENEKELTNEKATETDLKKTCDDSIKNQPERRQKRKIETEGLLSAREFLAGMGADALVQTPRSEKNVLPAFQTLSFLQRH